MLQSLALDNNILYFVLSRHKILIFLRLQSILLSFNFHLTNQPYS